MGDYSLVIVLSSLSALTLLVWWQIGHLASKNCAVYPKSSLPESWGRKPRKTGPTFTTKQLVERRQWWTDVHCCMQASAPSVLNRLKDVSVNVGEVAVLTCSVCGKPRPSIVWTGPDRTQISNSSQTLCDYYDDGLARLQVFVPSCLIVCSIMYLWWTLKFAVCNFINNNFTLHRLLYKQLYLPNWMGILCWFWPSSSRQKMIWWLLHYIAVAAINITTAVVIVAGNLKNCSLCTVNSLSLIHIWRCRRIERCRSRWSPYH